MLCEKCLNITLRRLEEDPDILVYSHYATLGLVHDSAKHCDLCRCISKACMVSWFLPPTMFDNRQSRYSEEQIACAMQQQASFGPTRIEVEGPELFSLGRTSHLLRTWSLTFRYGRSFATLWLFVPSTPQIFSELEEACSTDSRLMSPQNLLLAKRWMHHCSTHHPKCNSTATLPLWIIEIASEDQSTRLVRGSGRVAQYATLSYKWGSTVRYKMTSANQSDLQQQIPLDQMPRTFTDAIKVTRELGYSYLWIDALCITQDCAIELQDQVAAMQDIYSGSSLTLFAAAGDEADTGLDHERGPGVTRPIKVTLRLELEPNSADYETVIFVKQPFQPLSHLPLYSRGWVFQEQLLSRRSLIFTASQIKWQCLDECLSETSPLPEQRGRPVLMDYLKPRNLLDDESIMNIQNWIHTNSMLYQPMWLYYRAIELYSRRQLTFISDILPAIAGLVSVYEQRLKKTFVEGICLDELEGLLWTVRTNSTTAEARPVPNRPSWSWTSRFGSEVVFRAPDKHGATPSSSTHIRLQLNALPSCIKLEVTAWTRWVDLAIESRGTYQGIQYGIDARDEKSYTAFARLDDREWNRKEFRGWKSKDGVISRSMLCILIKRHRGCHYILARPHSELPGCFTKVGTALEHTNEHLPSLIGNAEAPEAVLEAQRRTADGPDYTIQYLV
ncbi:heterokaryon incompatibility protein-domain-containing protein [Boeremia exigua]|uniref:heterokaryon incompatibility protein-domain-containing protein n=1 Tax=Boeremia exigua TaxID=749465 RepID=UPI001E8E983E|nr:heterokaryon incompatibility protein-domain-containing protein [Boeremia exigua]KAH6641962.1 heterokaryon incompatibility protein-domain-containing protein [Boeremia exigua]